MVVAQLRATLLSFIMQVFCNDCDILVQQVLTVRGLNPHESTVLVGLDDGQGMVKICATIQGNRPEADLTNTEVADQKRSTYSEVELLSTLNFLYFRFV